jgi:hypothetical protein
MTVKQFGEVFNGARVASAHYGVAVDGQIGQYVDEDRRPAATSDGMIDSRMVSIELSNSKYGEPWPVSDLVIERGIDLMVDICRRNNIPRLKFTGDKTGTLVMHRYFAATACPGTYLAAKFSYIAAEVNKRLEDEDMTGEEIYKRLNEYLREQPCPDWAKAEFQEAVDAGITDGTRPCELIPRYQAALMAKRAVKK